MIIFYLVNAYHVHTIIPHALCGKSVLFPHTALSKVRSIFEGTVHFPTQSILTNVCIRLVIWISFFGGGDFRTSVVVKTVNDLYVC